MRILILGATGFLGSTLFQMASKNNRFDVFGTSRSRLEDPDMIQVDVTNIESIRKAIEKSNPEVVVWSIMDFEEEMKLMNVGLRNVISELESEVRLLFVSTDGAFVDGLGGYEESCQVGMLPKEAPLAQYVNGKCMGENIIRESHQNHVILRTGPLYGGHEDHSIEKRTIKMIERIKANKAIDAWEDVFRTFVNVNDLSHAILELADMTVRGTLHAGPQDKESYYTFFYKRLKHLGCDTSLLSPSKLSKEDFPYLSIDTSLNTDKAHQLLQTKFTSV